jgi:hypothetical protein
MDGSFACPECGSPVEVEGLAPGRQVRCAFCHRLLEVPYLRRVPVASWRRRRFGSPRWVPWAWSAIGVVLAVILVAGGMRFWKRHHQSAQEGSIHKLIESSRLHEDAGHFNQALIDLDAALLLAREAEPMDRIRLGEQRARRQELARRDAESVLDRLVREGSAKSPLGDWLNLIARCGHDTDLAALRPRIEERFRSVVKQRSDSELAFARQAFESGTVVASLESCDRIGKLLPHLSPEIRQAVRHEVEALVTRLVETHGIVVEAPQGQFVLGSHSSYVSTMLPVLVKALEAKNYLPNRASSPWRDLWTHALYHLRLDVSESQEGNYLSSENRLTRIEARLTLTSRDDVVWQTIPTARTTVPLPNLPNYLSTLLAVSPKRREDLERLLYDNARAQIDGKFAYALNNMPSCP